MNDEGIKEQIRQRIDLVKLLKNYNIALKPSSKGKYMGLCPFHDDHKASFEVNASSQKWKCYACGPEKGADCFAFVMKIKGVGFPEAKKILANMAGVKLPEKKGAREAEAIFDYLDEEGELLYQVLRYPGKEFRQRRPNGKGVWIDNVQGIRKVPYRLPDMLKTSIDDWVFIPEGEKHCDFMIDKWGLTATCNVMGAGKWTIQAKDLNHHFKGRKVCILPDNDIKANHFTGQRHAQDIAQNLYPIAEEIRILELPGLPPKGDILDWKDGGHTREELLELLEQTALWTPEKAKEQVPQGSGEDDDKEKDSIEQIIIDFIEADPSIVLFHDEKKNSFIRMQNQIIPVKSKTFKNYIREIVWDCRG